MALEHFILKHLCIYGEMVHMCHGACVKIRGQLNVLLLSTLRGLKFSLAGSAAAAASLPEPSP